TAPASGASGTFSGGSTTATVTADSSGMALAPTFTANNVAGSYTVTASVSNLTGAATFSLANATPATISSVSVSAITPSSATLSASVNPNGFATTAYFKWGTTMNLVNTTTLTSLG